LTSDRPRTATSTGGVASNHAASFGPLPSVYASSSPVAGVTPPLDALTTTMRRGAGAVADQRRTTTSLPTPGAVSVTVPLASTTSAFTSGTGTDRARRFQGLVSIKTSSAPQIWATKLPSGAAANRSDTSQASFDGAPRSPFGPKCSHSLFMQRQTPRASAKTTFVGTYSPGTDGAATSTHAPGPVGPVGAAVDATAGSARVTGAITGP
jgi:hypothetical protein